MEKNIVLSRDDPNPWGDLPKKWELEEQLQAACFQWFWNTKPNERQMLFHVQQKARNRVEGARFKAIGVTAGVSDLVLITRAYDVVWIEMKLPEGKQSAEQKEFESKVTDRGYLYLIRRSLIGFQRTVNYLLT